MEATVIPQEPIIINPGDLGWIYASNPIDPNLGHGVATIWENLELIYLEDLEQLFCVKRTHRNTIAPYAAYVKQHMKEYYELPDTRQAILQNFQIMYNEIPDDVRDDENVRGELHCRVDELRHELSKICDLKMKTAELERLRIINENWFADQLVFLMNIFISLMQIELNRYFDTLQV